ncbi:MAG: NUDIX domain-containing protein [bacterium]|nr:NUDIX domain-containing protein [bacterium]
MDLSVLMGETKLNIRVSVLLDTPKGFIFEKDKGGFYFPIGGRIKTNETSIESATREVKEEIGIDLNDIIYMSTIENFFEYDGIRYHEINIVHQTYFPDELMLPNGFHIFKKSDITNIDIKPDAIKKIICSNGNRLSHIIQKD